MPLSFKDFCSNKTVQDLAQIAGRSEATIRAWKAGTPIPSDVVIKFAEYYKVSCDRVLGHAIPAEIASNPEGFPARPPLVHTISEEHKQLASDHRQLRITHELQTRELKQLKEANEKLAQALEESRQIPIEVPTSKAEPDHSTEEIKALQVEIDYLKARLLSIHFLSEEKRGQ